MLIGVVAIITIFCISGVTVYKLYLNDKNRIHRTELEALQEHNKLLLAEKDREDRNAFRKREIGDRISQQAIMDTVESLGDYDAHTEKLLLTANDIRRRAIPPAYVMGTTNSAKGLGSITGFSMGETFRKMDEEIARERELERLSRRPNSNVYTVGELLDTIAKETPIKPNLDDLGRRLAKLAKEVDKLEKNEVYKRMKREAHMERETERRQERLEEIWNILNK